MGQVVGAIVLVWALLVGSAYCGRRIGFSRSVLILVLVLIYAVLATACLLILGSGWQAWLGAAGMIFPLAIAVTCVFIS